MTPAGGWAPGAGPSADESLLLLPDRPAQPMAAPAEPLLTEGPRISCIMATRGRIAPARHAIDCFLRQSYRDRELVIACAGAGEEVRAHVARLGDPRVRFLSRAAPPAAGLLRNAAIAAATGRHACTWDDDDLSDPDRLARQFAALAAAGAAACFLSRTLLWWPSRRRIAISSQRVWENSMLAERAALPPYEAGDRGSDTILAKHLRATAPLVLIDRPDAYCYVAHGANLWSEDHFALLFANASETPAAADYAATIARLGRRLPLAAYAADLAAAGR